MSKTDKNQGEGDREAARRYNEAQQTFVEEGGVEEAAEDRENLSGEALKEAEEAERKGKERAKEKDPSVVRNFADETD